MYRWVEHTGELELAIEAESEEGVFADALDALAELIAEGAAGETERRDVELSGGDRAALLADWLGELVFLAEIEDFVPERVEAFVLDGDSLRARVAGRLGTPRHLVKAVTYHRLRFANADGRWRAGVVLDV